jgi:hypothetical protein
MSKVHVCTCVWVWVQVQHDLTATLQSLAKDAVEHSPTPIAETRAGVRVRFEAMRLGAIDNLVLVIV